MGRRLCPSGTKTSQAEKSLGRRLDTILLIDAAYLRQWLGIGHPLTLLYNFCFFFFNSSRNECCKCNSFNHLFNSPVNYCGNNTQAVKIPSSTGGRRRTTKSKKCKLPLLGELSRSSRDSFESESDSKESRDDRANSPKSGILNFLFGSGLTDGSTD